MRVPEMTDYSDIFEYDAIAYNVYTLVDGAIDTEEGFPAECGTAAAWNEFLRQKQYAETWNCEHPEDSLESTVHLYDVLAGVMVAEVCIPKL